MPAGNADLTLAILIYATACLENGDWAVLRDLNFGQQEIEALESLQFSEFLSIADRLDGHVLDISVNRERFWLVLKEMKAERAIEKLKTEMVCRDAPVEMMRQLFGMTDRQYTAMRRRFRCSRRGPGRPAEPDIETMDTIWAAWQRDLDGREPQSAAEWLELSDASGVDCRTMWRFIRGANAVERTS